MLLGWSYALMLVCIQHARGTSVLHPRSDFRHPKDMYGRSDGANRPSLALSRPKGPLGVVHCRHSQPPRPGVGGAMSRFATGVGGGVRIHPENARMSGRHGVQYVSQCVACAALTLVGWQ